MRKSLLVLVVVVAAFAGQYDLFVCHCDTGAITKVEDNIGTDPFYTSVDYLDCSTTTPTVATMLNYGCILTWSDDPYQNSTQMGNNLADYMDGGGKVLSCTFAHFWVDGWGISGRYTSDENYCPVARGGQNFDFTTLGIFDPHPIMNGVTSISNIYYWEEVTTRASATWIADLANGTDFVAMNSARNAVAINFYPGDYGQWTGDGWILLNNAIHYLMDSGPEDYDPPFVSGMEPGDGDVGVPYDSTILFHCKDSVSGVDTTTIDFTARSITLDAGSASVSNRPVLRVEPDRAGIIPGTLDIDDANPLDVVCTFTPDADLPPDATIICVVDDKLADLQGNQMSDNFIWTFTTGNYGVEEKSWGAVKAEF
jgi:hypothetical protein